MAKKLLQCDYCNDGWHESHHNGDLTTCSCPYGQSIDQKEDFVSFIRRLFKLKYKYKATVVEVRY